MGSQVIVFSVTSYSIDNFNNCIIDRFSIGSRSNEYGINGRIPTFSACIRQETLFLVRDNKLNVLNLSSDVILLDHVDESLQND